MPTPLTLDFLESHPREAARLTSQLPVRQVLAFLRETPPANVARLIPFLPAATSALCMKTLDPEAAAKVIDELDVATAGTLLRRLRPRRRAAILAGVQTVKSGSLQLMLDYPPGSAGAVMDPLALSLAPDVSAAAALRQIRLNRHKPQHYFFVVGDQAKVLGVVSLHELLLSSQQAHVGSFMGTGPATVSARQDIGSLQKDARWLEMDMLPVVNQRGSYLGVLRYALVHAETSVSVDPGVDGLGIVWDLLESTGSLVGKLLAAPAGRRTRSGAPADD